MLPKLFDHLRWADARTLTSLRAMREAPPQAMDLFAHLLAAQHVWLRRIEAAPTAYEVFPRLSLDEIERLMHANHAEFDRIAQASASELDRVVHYSNSSGNSFEMPVRDILLHVTHHSMYHRGQVALIVRAAGGTPVGTDLIVFLRE